MLHDSLIVQYGVNELLPSSGGITACVGAYVVSDLLFGDDR